MTSREDAPDVKRRLAACFLLLSLSLSGCGAVTSAKSLLKGTALVAKLSKLGSLKKLGFATGVLLASRADDTRRFLASSDLKGLDALCLGADFLTWAGQPRADSSSPAVPPEASKALSKAIPGGQALSPPKRFDGEFWAQPFLLAGERYIVVHRAGQTVVLTEAPRPLWETVLLLLAAFLALYCVVATVVYRRHGSLGDLSPARLAFHLDRLLTPTETKKGVIGVGVCLYLLTVPISHYLWMKKVHAAPTISTVEQLEALDWNDQRLIRFACPSGPVLRKSGEEEYQLRTLGERSVLVYLESRISENETLIGTTGPLLPGFVEELEKRGADAVGTLECYWVNESSGTLQQTVVFELLTLLGLAYFLRLLLKSTAGEESEQSDSP